MKTQKLQNEDPFLPNDSVAEYIGGTGAFLEKDWWREGHQFH
jgi:hypothetical protein